MPTHIRNLRKLPSDLTVLRVVFVTAGWTSGAKLFRLFSTMLSSAYFATKSAIATFDVGRTGSEPVRTPVVLFDGPTHPRSIGHTKALCAPRCSETGQQV
jgi:hypothetical protein